jgi:hypothetical protein
MPGPVPGIVVFGLALPKNLRRWAACALHPVVINSD